jgi:hypothetical protein
VIGGCLQSASRLFKRAAVCGLRDCYNYDLEASQPNALRLQLSIAGVAQRTKKWLDEYLSTLNYKTVYSKAAGLSVDGWKTLTMSLIFGAKFPDKATVPIKVQFPDRKGIKESCINQLFWVEAGENLERAVELHSKSFEIIRPLIEGLREWHDWLLDVYVPSTKKVAPRNGREYIVNDVGKRLYLESLPKKRHKAAARIAAFLLQGAESAFIHRLTTLGPKHRFKVIHNVLTFGEVPKAAVKEAAETSGFTQYANLIVKPYEPLNLDQVDIELEKEAA